MAVRHPQSPHRVALEVELDHDDWLGADHPAVVAGIDRDDLRRLVFDDAAVGVFDVNLAVGQEPDMGVHAEVGLDDRLHIDRPLEPRRVNHAFDARGAGAAHFQADVPDVAPLGALHRGQQRIHRGGPASGWRSPLGWRPAFGWRPSFGWRSTCG
jgi:hypothetical protein